MNKIFLQSKDLLNDMENKGFSLIEILVVIAIIGMIAIVALANTNLMRANARVSSVANLILDEARDIRQKAISVEQFSNSYPGYGLHFNVNENQSFIVFADCIADDNQDGRVDHDDRFHFSSNNPTCGSNASDDIVKTVEFDKLVEIKEIRFIGLGASDSQIIDGGRDRFDIQFLRPEPTVWLTTGIGALPDQLTPAGRVELKIGNTGGDHEQTVIFTSAGLVYIK